MARFDLTDSQWERLQPLLPPEHSGEPGRPYVERRRVINGILWVLHTGAPWADLPERYGPHQTAYDRYVRWRKRGVWAAVVSGLQAQTDAEGRLQGAYAAVDATILPAPQRRHTRSLCPGRGEKRGRNSGRAKQTGAGCDSRRGHWSQSRRPNDQSASCLGWKGPSAGI